MVLFHPMKRMSVLSQSFLTSVTTERSAGVAPEVIFREHTSCMPPPSADKAEPTLALKPRGDITRSPKQGYQWPHRKDLCPRIFFKEEYELNR